MPSIAERFQALGTPQIADAVARLGLRPSIAPSGIRPLVSGQKACGPASPVVLFGFADRLLEGIYRSEKNSVLVVDNRGRASEACFGDLAAHEARSQEISGVVIWGLHRDSQDVTGIGVPLWSYGTYPLGMQTVYDAPEDPFRECRFGAENVIVVRGDYVFADEDGVVFSPADRVVEIVETAEKLKAAEDEQVRLIREGTSFREQIAFDDFVAAREKDPGLTLGRYLQHRKRSF